MAEISIPTNIILIFWGFLPSVVWLLIFLKKDPRPEPRYLIVKVFLFGVIIAPVVVLLEAIVSGVFRTGFISSAALFFTVAAFIEEYMKYWVVKNSVISKPDFDEPHDSIIYMITAALGFAAMENILIAFKIYPEGFAATLGIIS